MFDPATLKAPEDYLETAISYTEPLLRKEISESSFNNIVLFNQKKNAAIGPEELDQQLKALNCSCGGPRFGSQYPHQVLTTVISGNLTPSSGL